jgi:polysaccharide pyruvyl transferase WcaK-like protein
MFGDTMRIAHYGTFDVANYGDALFPLVVERRLPDATVTHVSPLGGPSRYRDGVQSVSCQDADGLDFDGVLVGGGNILSVDRTSLPDYESVESTAYPSLWLGAAALAQRQNIPLVVNAPSVSRSNHNRRLKWMLRSVGDVAAYVAVRDEPSRLAFADSRVRVVPDTAMDVDGLWSEHDLAAAVAKHGLAGTPTFAIHMKKKYLPSVVEAARVVDELARRLEARAVFVAIGVCHGDHDVHERVAALMETDPVCVVPESLVEVAGLIRHSLAYIGSSMHGFLTGTSFGTPSLLVLNEAPHHKFGGLLAQLDLDPSVSIASSWSAVSLASLSTVDAGSRARVDSRLDTHWGEVSAALEHGECGRSLISRNWLLAAKILQFPAWVREVSHRNG